MGGVVGLRGNSKGEVRLAEGKTKSKKGTEKFIAENEYLDATTIDYRYHYGIRGGRAEVIKKDVLQRYPFPKIDGEKFMPESYLWFSTAKDGYKFRWFNKVIYFTEFLDDGLTKNMKTVGLKNCQSFAYIHNFMLTLDGLYLKSKVHAAMLYYYYCLISGKDLKDAYRECSSKLFAIVALPYALYLNIFKPKDSKGL